MKRRSGLEAVRELRSGHPIFHSQAPAEPRVAQVAAVDATGPKFAPMGGLSARNLDAREPESESEHAIAYLGLSRQTLRSLKAGACRSFTSARFDVDLRTWSEIDPSSVSPDSCTHCFRSQILKLCRRNRLKMTHKIQWLCAGAVAIATYAAPSISSTWTVLPDMAQPRVFHTLSLIGDGTVLVAGGQNGTGVLASAQLYDPAATTWLDLPPMNTSRTGHTATVLGNGDVLIAGGFGIAFAERFSVSTRTWSPAAPMGEARSGHTATLLTDGRILVAGSCYSASVEIFDPVVNVWTPAASMSVPRCEHTATRLPNGRVLVAGGSMSGSTVQPTSSAEIFDPATGTWTPVMPMNQARYGHAMAQLEAGRLLVTGGIGVNTEFLASAEAFDWVQGTWSPVAPMLQSRYGFPLQRLLDGTLVAIGGFSGGIGATVTSERFDPATGSWSLVGSLNAIRGDRIAATLMSDGRVLATGGSDGTGGALSGAERFEVDQVFLDGFEAVQ